KTGIALRSANHEPAGRVNEVTCFWTNPFGRNYFLDYALYECLPDLLVLYIGRVLGRNDYSIDANRAVAFVLDGNLRLCIRTEPWQFARFAQPCQLSTEAVAQLDRGRHQFRSFPHGK